MKRLPSLYDICLANQNVLMRLDLNVPLHDGHISSDARIQAALPTIRYALNAGAKLTLASHLGRPKGVVQPDESLEPVASRLSELLEQDVILADDCLGDGVQNLVQNLRPGQLLVLENLRFHAGEEANDPEFARRLAAPFDVYINDAFGVCHRAHASVVGVVRYCKDVAAGFLLEKEVKILSTLLHTPAQPFVAIIGGAKVSDKLGVLGALLKRVQSICIGGAMAYTFLKAQGIDPGQSRYEADKLHTARDILERARARGVEILLPSDHVGAPLWNASAPATVISTPEIPPTLMGLDIGPQTQKQYAARIHKAATVFWNGPMGVFEWKSFAAGTHAIATAMSRTSGYTVVGGGDSEAALRAEGVLEDMDHVSTGGGASLEFLQEGTLPGIEALQAHAPPAPQGYPS